MKQSPKVGAALQAVQAMAANHACKTFIPMLSAYVDGELPVSERTTLERHLSACTDCTGRVADLRATGGLIRVGMDFATDEVDFKDFAQKVLARVTPERPPLWDRIRISASEMFLYQRGPMMASFATAALLLLIGVPLVMRSQTPVGYASEQMMVESVKAVEGADVAPVVLTTDEGDAIIWVVDDETKPAALAGPDDEEDDEDEEEDAFRHKDPRGPVTPREGEL